MTTQKKALRSAHHHKGTFNAVEVAIISPLIESTGLNDDLLDECVSRGFIPLKVGSALNLAKFLSRTILAAQLAQRTYGVPASFLISLGLYDSGWSAEDLADESGNPIEWPGCKCCYSPGIHAWFDSRAKAFATSRRYAPARALTNDVEAYVRKLGSLGFRDSLDIEDILSPIQDYGLQECDLPAMRDANVYKRENFNLCRDEARVTQLRSSLLPLLLPPGRTGQRRTA